MATYFLKNKECITRSRQVLTNAKENKCKEEHESPKNSPTKLNVSNVSVCYICMTVGQTRVSRAKNS